MIQLPNQCVGLPLDRSKDGSLGRVIDAKVLPGVTAGHCKVSHDWALFTLNALKANHATWSEQGALERRQDIHVVERPHFHDHESEPVLVLRGAAGSVRGKLTSLPAAIMVEQSGIFVQTYPMNLEFGCCKSSVETSNFIG